MKKATIIVKRKKKMNYEELVRFTLEKYSLASSTFKLFSLEGEERKRFLMGQSIFEDQAIDIESEIIKGRTTEEYGFSPELEEILDRLYAQMLGIDDKNMIKVWMDIHEKNKREFPRYSQFIAPNLDTFFKYVKELLSHDFLILYFPQKLKFLPKKERGRAIVEEALHFCYKRGRKKVPIEHDEVVRLARKIVKEYGEKRK